MPRYSTLSRSQTLHDGCSITSNLFLTFLLPTFFGEPCAVKIVRRKASTVSRQHVRLESILFTALSHASACSVHQQKLGTSSSRPRKEPRTSFPIAGSRCLHSRLSEGNGETNESIDQGGRRSDAAQHLRNTQHGFFDFNEQEFSAGSRLPLSFFHDVDSIRNLIPPQQPSDMKRRDRKRDAHLEPSDSGKTLDERLQLLKSVRDLEAKLAKAKKDLEASLKRKEARSSDMYTAHAPSMYSEPVLLTKEDYINLVDLYYYSHNSRFSPESTDSSPTPLFLEDYSFMMSSDFSQAKQGGEDGEILNEDENYESPLKDIDRMLKEGKLKEIAAMQTFVDLLLDDYSSNRALYDAYKQLPHPGVAFLPSGVIRLFLQRMSTPWTKSEKSMLRYLSLIDDMQAARLRINKAEWSSAVYLAGRSFARVTQSDLAHAFSIWKQMEHEAGVESSNVTFNILFGIAVRAGKFALGETIMKEMHQRNLRLNRIGRLSLMYYHGLRGDGDGVRKTYRDFVEAGEIVDTLVLNCVIASLINAQEPIAAEQIYLRMKDIHLRRQQGRRDNEDSAPYKRYPAPSDIRLDGELASNHLGRILGRAPRLRQWLPDHHAQLQETMPLRPNMYTFRPMLAYHASVSGDLDKLTVALNDMIELFKLPLSTIIFQLLFKGFAIHGPRGGPSTVWTKKRLDMTWDACRTAIKASRSSIRNDDDDVPPLPSIQDIKSEPDLHATSSTTSEQSESAESASIDQKTKRKTLSSWNLLVLDLAAFPRERLKRLHRYHSSQFDDDGPPDPSADTHPAILSPSQREVFENSFFQARHYDAPREEWDHEEGEYVLPSPTNSRMVDPGGQLEREYQSQDGNSSGDGYPDLNSSNEEPLSEVSATRPLVNWLLRAYARCTGSRDQVEEVFNSVRKVWKPRDDKERQSVIRVLRRCLRDCDQESGFG